MARKCFYFVLKINMPAIRFSLISLAQTQIKHLQSLGVGTKKTVK